jgi:hypothetical protein
MNPSSEELIVIAQLFMVIVPSASVLGVTIIRTRNQKFSSVVVKFIVGTYLFHQV